ncbi:fibronectin type III domain-containing protein [Winogradskyella psychrotolerans]|uniref:fibronectin type III domain-containing protein n=1 Tax=Winogradskyella psychrotolerans TaxID=1344585 RepID=UPI001C06C2B5|nr:T9SS type A sorting domain-containing protein [Winogradskyella psychrotolerans]MBU2927872.1 T9SS type A sorting domain-containing protein [Winogradskyella psychrotolerans]
MIKKILPICTLLLFMINVSAQTFNIPFTEDFESSEAGGTSSPNAPEGWFYLNSGMGGYTYVRANLSSAQSGAKYYRLHSGVDSDGDYMLISPEISELTTTGILVNFSVSGLTGEELQIGTMADPSDASTFNLLDTKILTSNNNYEDVQINIPQGTDSYFAVRHGVISTQVSLNLDDFSFTAMPSCIVPENLTVSGITSTSATLSWETETTAINGYDYILTAENIIPESTSSPLGSVAAEVTTVNVTDLIAGQIYYAFVRGNCGSLKSEWSNGIGFQAPCFVSIPFSENFEGLTSGSTANPNYPSCWNSFNSGDASSGGTYISNFPNNPDAQSGEGCYVLKNVVDIFGDYMLVSPAINELITDGVKVEFGVKGSPNKELEIGTMTNPTDILTFTVLQTITLSTNEYENIELNIPSGTDSFFAVRLGQTATFTVLNLDNFVFSEISDCNKPENLTLVNVTDSTANISWTEPVEVPTNGYEYVVILDESLPDNETVPSGSIVGTTLNLTDLDANTTYDVYVRSICNLNNNSSWSNVLNFTTATVSNFISIPDSNFEQALIDLNIDTDGVVNGQMLQSDAIGITSLDVSDENISDLTGIAYFTDLLNLFAVNNTIATIDVSQNTALTGLVLTQNNLTSIDVSNNSNLQTLILSDNEITSIDLSNHTSLSKLYLHSNSLSEIDTSVLPALSEFVIFQNDLSELDLSQNLALIQVLCSENDLVSLNLQNGNNTSISGVFFDATQNPNLTCIQVDDSDYSELNWTAIDSQTTFSTSCSPENDDCVDATSITLGQDTPGTTVNSTSSDFNPACQQEGIVILDVWFQFIAPASGSVTMTLGVPVATAKVAIYEDCLAQSPLDCAQDELQINNLNAGQTYYLQVWLEASVSGRSSTLNQEGDFVLNVQDTSVLSLDTIKHESNEIKLHPNPAKDKVTITSDKIITRYEIFDMTGKVILAQSGIQNLSHSISTTSLSKGIYLIKIKGEQHSITKKLIIQ